ncbi:MAG: DUF481 domain-containing protein [Nitrospirota bacterium]
MKKIIYSAIVTLLISSVAHAAEPASDRYKGNVELGLIKTSGNTKTQSVNAKSKLEIRYGKFLHTLNLTTLNSKDSKGMTIAEKDTASLKSDYRFSERDYIFGLLTYEEDEFNGYDYQGGFSAGYGRKVINHERVSLNLELGPGFRRARLNNGTVQKGLIWRLAGDFDWKISKTALFEEDLSVETGNNLTITKSVTALTAQIVGQLAMKTAITVKNTSKVPVSVKKTDTETSVTLVYTF